MSRKCSPQTGALPARLPLGQRVLCRKQSSFQKELGGSALLLSSGECGDLGSCLPCAGAGVEAILDHHRHWRVRDWVVLWSLACSHLGCVLPVVTRHPPCGERRATGVLSMMSSRVVHVLFFQQVLAGDCAHVPHCRTSCRLLWWRERAWSSLSDWEAHPWPGGQGSDCCARVGG